MGDTTLVEMKCPVCGVRYGLEEAYREYRLNGGAGNDGKAGWWCPNGDYLLFLDDAIDRHKRERAARNVVRLEVVENDTPEAQNKAERELTTQYQ